MSERARSVEAQALALGLDVRGVAPPWVHCLDVVQCVNDDTTELWARGRGRSERLAKVSSAMLVRMQGRPLLDWSAFTSELGEANPRRVLP